MVLCLLMPFLKSNIDYNDYYCTQVIISYSALYFRKPLSFSKKNIFRKQIIQLPISIYFLFLKVSAGICIYFNKNYSSYLYEILSNITILILFSLLIRLNL